MSETAAWRYRHVYKDGPVRWHYCDYDPTSETKDDRFPVEIEALVVSATRVEALGSVTDVAAAQKAYDVMIYASWAAERCGAGEHQTACVVALQNARDELAKHVGVARFDYKGPSWDELFSTLPELEAQVETVERQRDEATNETQFVRSALAWCVGKLDVMGVPLSKDVQRAMKPVAALDTPPAGRAMKKTDCSECMALLDAMFAPPFGDIPTTMNATRAVWATQECAGAHTLDAWVANPNGRVDTPPAKEATT